MTAVIQRFYSSEEQFNLIHARLKLCLCPHCHLSGFLIWHGFLYGYADLDASLRIKRGHRVFCSNRNRKKSCGRTFSLLHADVIRKYRISASSLWKFLGRVKDGCRLAQAFRQSGSALSASSIYRIFRAFLHCQPRIRSFLTRIKGPPLVHTEIPAVQTLYHLASVFTGDVCPVAGFQAAFQESFL